jgi:hypothetical protein
MSETNEMANPAAIGVVVNSTAHNANVKIRVTPVLPALVVPIRLIDGLGQETNREAQLDFGCGIIIAHGGGPCGLGVASVMLACLKFQKRLDGVQERHY